ncbi:triose-phosphate isomerase [Bdellovibrionota bacterium FG-2]
MNSSTRSQKPRGVLIAGNWKMNHGAQETETFFSELSSGVSGASVNSTNLSACIIPTFLRLEQASGLAKKAPFPLHVAAQNGHWEKKGAFTGETSGPMLKELGINWVLIGHSERRQFFGETDETARKRSESLLEQGFRVILCIGESRAEREAGKTTEILTRQLLGALPNPGQGAAAYLDGRLVIAYEPVWAIGTGLTATPEQAEEAHQVIRKLLWDRFGMDAAAKTQLLYGGSATPENADALLSCANVDGLLVGGASLKADSFQKLLAAGARVTAGAIGQ